MSLGDTGRPTMIAGAATAAADGVGAIAGCDGATLAVEDGAGAGAFGGVPADVGAVAAVVGMLAVGAVELPVSIGVAGLGAAACGTPTLITIWLGRLDGAGAGDALDAPALPVGDALDCVAPSVVVFVEHVDVAPASRCTTGSGYGRSSGVKMLLNSPSRAGD